MDQVAELRLLRCVVSVLYVLVAKGNIGFKHVALYVSLFESPSSGYELNDRSRTQEIAQADLAVFRQQTMT